jgi:hypothetical protein
LVIPVAKGHWVIPRTARTAARERFVAAIDMLRSPEPRDLLPPRVSWWCVLVLQFFLPPPGELCGRGWSQLGGGHSGDAFRRDWGGKTAPPLVH